MYWSFIYKMKNKSLKHGKKIEPCTLWGQLSYKWDQFKHILFFVVAVLALYKTCHVKFIFAKFYSFKVGHFNFLNKIRSINNYFSFKFNSRKVPIFNIIFFSLAILLRFSGLKTNLFRAVAFKLFVVSIKSRFEFIKGRRCYNIIRKTFPCSYDPIWREIVSPRNGLAKIVP